LTFGRRGRLVLSPTFAWPGHAQRVFWLQPRTVLDVIATADADRARRRPDRRPGRVVPRRAEALTCAHRLVEIDGAQRWYWKAPTIRVVAEWIIAGR